MCAEINRAYNGTPKALYINLFVIELIPDAMQLTPKLEKENKLTKTN